LHHQILQLKKEAKVLVISSWSCLLKCVSY
jgi:hypothetical protein